MKKLSRRTQELISTGLKTVGHNEPLEPYFYIEESLYVNEAKEVARFFEWLFRNRRPFGQINAQQRWAEFQAGQFDVKEYLDLQYSFTYTINTTDGKFTQTANMVARLDDDSLTSVKVAMRSCSPSNHYTLKVVDQDGKVVKTYTHEQVFGLKTQPK